jgi:cysteine desulfurase
MSKPIYMDYNATCPIRPSVIEKVAEVMAEVGNPSSVHAAGRKARGVVEEARAKVAALTSARPRDVMFCSGGTEAANTVISGSGAASLIISAIEHDCVLAAAGRADVPVYKAPVTADGALNMAALADILDEAPKPALVSVMFANNEMGALQPVAEIAALAAEHDALVHTDAVQAAGKVPLDMAALGVNYMTLSSHKIGGPQGVGAVILSPTAPLKPLVVGGGQELARRSGTENVAGIAGFGEAAMEAMVALGDMGRLEALRERLESCIKEHSNEALILGEGASRTANTSCIALPGVKGETQVMHFDLAGICVSSGSACSSGKVKVSHVLSAMGYADEVASSSIRVSLGYKSSEEDVDAFVAAWKKLYDRTVGRS